MERELQECNGSVAEKIDEVYNEIETVKGNIEASIEEVSQLNFRLKNIAWFASCVRHAEKKI